MNYYEHHIGDYAEATSHLSFVEDAAYSRLIRKYYSTEKPLPADIKSVQRLVGARTKEEKKSVEVVLSEFFFLCDDGWHNSRCDAEISSYRDGEPEREVKKANEENRLKRHRAERAELFKRLTGAGHHASWNIGMQELRDLVKRICDGGAPQPETPSETATATAPATPATATHTPDTRHQTPEVNPKSEQVDGSGSVRAPDPTPAAQVCLGLKAMGYSDTSPHDFELSALLQNGMTPGEIIAIGQEFKGQGKRFRYLLATAKGRRQDAAKIQPLPAKPAGALTKAGQATAEAAARWLKSEGEVA